MYEPDDQQKAWGYLAKIRKHKLLRRFVIGLFLACLLARLFVEVVDNIAGVGSRVDLIMNTLFFLVVVAGFFAIRHLFRTSLNFTVDELHPPFGWSPTVGEDFVRNYRSMWMEVDENGQLRPKSNAREQERREEVSEGVLLQSRGGAQFYPFPGYQKKKAEQDEQRMDADLLHKEKVCSLV